MIVPKNWGYEDILVNTESYCGKRMLVYEEHRCSVHMHKIKDETLLVSGGLVWFETGNEPDQLHGIWMKDNERIRITPGLWHRFTALRDSTIIEVSTHHEDSDSYRHILGGKIGDAEMRSLLTNFFKFENQDRILTPDRAMVIASSYRCEGRKIGMVNGCFDLMHLGHVELLRQARSRCEILFVAVNADSSVRQIKGKVRPFIDEIGRMGMVESNRFVDFVVEAHEASCINVVNAIKPDVYITTSEYGMNGPEAKEVLKYGGSVEVIDMIRGYNTTAIAASVKNKL